MQHSVLGLDSYKDEFKTDGEKIQIIYRMPDLQT